MGYEAEAGVAEFASTNEDNEEEIEVLRWQVEEFLAALARQGNSKAAKQVLEDALALVRK
jgi:hypothetical protein